MGLGSREGKPMAITMSWANDQRTVIYYAVEGRWSWNELYAVINHAHALMDGVNHRVDSIIDLRKSLGVPGGPMWHGRRLASNRHPNTGRMVFVGAPPFLSTLFDTMRRIYPEAVARVMFAETPEEAQALLEPAPAVVPQEAG